MEIKILNNTYNLLEGSREYYIIIRDVLGNTMNSVVNALDNYSVKKDEKSLSLFKATAKLEHAKFDKLFENVLVASERNKIIHELGLLINILKKQSEFDWSNPKKFEKFYNKTQQILKVLKKL